MAKWNVSLDVTFGCSIEVDAENEEQALKLAEKEIDKDPRYYIRNGWHVKTSAVEADKEE